ncbi:hypothetical protein Hanom_Chr04g00376301 [Helianthus anomalus]
MGSWPVIKCIIHKTQGPTQLFYKFPYLKWKYTILFLEGHIYNKLVSHYMYF